MSDPGFSFSDLYAKETVKRELREAIEAIVADIQPHLAVETIATRLVDLAMFHSYSFKGRHDNGWPTNAVESLKRLRDGRLRTTDDLMREIANRNLSANTRPGRD